MNQKAHVGRVRLDGFDPERIFQRDLVRGRGIKGVDVAKGRNDVADHRALLPPAPELVLALEYGFQAWAGQAIGPAQQRQHGAYGEIQVTDQGIDGSGEIARDVGRPVENLPYRQATSALHLLVTAKFSVTVFLCVPQLMQLREVQRVEPNNKNVLLHGLYNICQR